MEIQAWAFFSIWTVIGVGSLFLGIRALDRTDLSNSISPAIISLFKHSIAISVFHSSTYALILRPKIHIPVKLYYSWLLLAVFPIIFSGIAGESCSWHFPIYSLVNFFVLSQNFVPQLKNFILEGHFCKLFVVIALLPLLRSFSPDVLSQRYFTIYITNFMIIFQFPFAVVPEEQIGLFIHFCAVSSLILVGGKTESYFPSLVLCLSLLTSVVQAAISGDERFKKLLPASITSRENGIVEKVSKIMKKKKGRAIEFAIGIGGAIMFQKYFRSRSWDELVAFLYLAVAWVSNLALTLSNNDIGIFNFMLSNVMVGCTVSKLRAVGSGWICYGACGILYVIRMKLKGLSLVKKGEYQVSMVTT